MAEQQVAEGIADYRFTRSLGEGTHGRFYLAEPPARLGLADSAVAVKVLDGPGGDAALAAMTEELRLFASVPCPQLATLLDAGAAGGTCYYAMRYYPLGSLETPSRPLRSDEVIGAVADAARAAHALHEAGVAHRDIKPANVLLDDGGGGRLSDLGLAKVMAPGMTMTGMGSIGSVEFVDPELIRGGRASRASDVWSLGATLHRALTGRSIYGALPESDPLLALRHVLKTPPRVDPALDGEVAAVVSATLAPAGERVATAGEVADRLDALR